MKSNKRINFVTVIVFHVFNLFYLDHGSIPNQYLLFVVVSTSVQEVVVAWNLPLKMEQDLVMACVLVGPGETQGLVFV